MNAAPLYSFPARMDSLADMLALVRTVLSDAESPAAQRAETALEELLTNSVVHGAGPGTGASVWLGVSADGEVLSMRYEDGCSAFDPRPAIDAALQRTRNPMEQRPVGGLGLLMVYRLADVFEYVHENGRNCMRLAFRPRDFS